MLLTPIKPVSSIENGTSTKGSVLLELHTVGQNQPGSAYENKEVTVPNEPHIRTVFPFLLFPFACAPYLKTLMSGAALRLTVSYGDFSRDPEIPQGRRDSRLNQKSSRSG